MNVAPPNIVVELAAFMLDRRHRPALASILDRVGIENTWLVADTLLAWLHGEAFRPYGQKPASLPLNPDGNFSHTLVDVVRGTPELQELFIVYERSLNFRPNLPSGIAYSAVLEAARSYVVRFGVFWKPEGPGGGE
ncbi:MAG TPA: hypothetical protein VEA69_20445 [Tepidisphaeraceae bacterium]|nr:hypothetical protein [Tepidisphaeraceae bacterium]